MALIRLGRTPCLICWQAINDPVDCIGFPHFIENEEDPLSMYSDGAFHQSCFDSWSKKNDFLERYKAFQKSHKWGSNK